MQKFERCRHKSTRKWAETTTLTMLATECHPVLQNTYIPLQIYQISLILDLVSQITTFYRNVLKPVTFAKSKFYINSYHFFKNL